MKVTKFRETCKSVMNLAWQFIKQNGFSLSVALKKAWLNIKLKMAMLKEETRFTFIKKDGSIREAVGHLTDMAFATIKGTSDGKQNDKLQSYYDTEKQAWRCFYKCNLVSIG